MARSGSFSFLPDGLARAGVEIEDRGLHLLAGEKPDERVVEQLHVQRLERLEVRLPFLVPRREGVGLVVVVQGDRDGIAPHHPELDHELLGESGLARRRRTRDEDQLHLIALRVDAVRDLRDLLVLEGLGDLDELLDAAVPDQLVEPSHGSDAQDLAPVLVLPVDGEEHGVLHEWPDAQRILRRGIAQEKARRRTP